MDHGTLMIDCHRYKSAPATRLSNPVTHARATESESKPFGMLEHSNVLVRPPAVPDVLPIRAAESAPTLSLPPGDVRQNLRACHGATTARISVASVEKDRRIAHTFTHEGYDEKVASLRTSSGSSISISPGDL